MSLQVSVMNQLSRVFKSS